MPRATLVLILLLVALVAALIFLSSSVEPVPIRTIEQDVTANAG